MTTGQVLFDFQHSPFGDIAVVWFPAQTGPQVLRIILCGPSPAEDSVRLRYLGAQRRTAPEIDDLGGRIRRFLCGEDIVFDLGMMAMETCGRFQRRVLEAEHAVPRGWVSTYGRLAKQAGAEGGARAAGCALAENPFPIVIPCHRTVRSNGDLGGYQGGAEMKRALLEMEGVAFDERGRVVLHRVYYV
jgi:methylated-DNA-[protein]-cysteine S-methyltransferase